MENDNVIDITDRGKLMGRIVEDNAVQLIEMGSSGKNYCLTLSKNALIAIREGSSFPLELSIGGHKMKLTVLRDNTFKRRMQIHKKLNEEAKESVQRKIDAEQAVGLGKSLGEKLDLEQ